jgi:predicted nucleic acid-binding protein
VLKALPDTNQLVSSLLSTRGLQRQLIDAWRGRAFLLMLVPGQVEEVAEVLRDLH